MESPGVLQLCQHQTKWKGLAVSKQGGGREQHQGVIFNHLMQILYTELLFLFVRNTYQSFGVRKSGKDVMHNG